LSISNGGFEISSYAGVDYQNHAAVSSWTSGGRIVITNYNSAVWGGAGNKMSDSGNYYLGLENKNSWIMQVVNITFPSFFTFAARSRLNSGASQIIVKCNGRVIFGPMSPDNNWEQYSSKICLASSGSRNVTLQFLNDCLSGNCTFQFDIVAQLSATSLYYSYKSFSAVGLDHT
jgi:hypothetical protein